MVLPYTDMNQPWMYMCSPSWTPLPLPSPSHPSGSSQCTSPEHPVSCIEPGLVICFTYDNIHVSVLFSQIIPPSPSPTESKSLFFTCVSCAVSHIGSSLPSFKIPYICINILYWCFSFWLPSLCINPHPLRLLHCTQTLTCWAAREASAAGARQRPNDERSWGGFGMPHHPQHP